MTKMIKNRGLIPYHFLNTKSDKGFTLIELLVVIAIIGILSSVVLASLSSARKKGRIAAAQSTMKGIQTGGAMCLNQLPPVDVGIPTMTQDGGGGSVCPGDTSNLTVYSKLPVGWIYCSGTPGTSGAGDASNCNNSTAPSASIETPGTSFRISAYSSADLKTLITCTETSCKTCTSTGCTPNIL